MNQSLPFLSIVTPAYNRGELLKDCWMSLKSQTDKSFEWIIVDDGSTDNTEAAVSQMIIQTPEMSITYVKKENGGKHTALNASHPYIKGYYVLILDSDDVLIPEAVRMIHEEWQKYEDDKNIGMLVFLRGETIDAPFAYAKDEYVPVDYTSYQRVKVKSSDCCEVIRTYWFKRFPFPVFKGEKFISEGVLWYRTAWHSKSIYINKVIYISHYLEGGLTSQGRSMRIRNPKGGMFNSELLMDRKNPLMLRVKNALLFECYGFFANLRWKKIIRLTKRFHGLKLLCIFPAYIMYRIWEKKY